MRTGKSAASRASVVIPNERDASLDPDLGKEEETLVPLKYVMQHVLDKEFLSMTDIGKARIEHRHFMNELEEWMRKFESHNCAQSIKECRAVYPTIRVMGTGEKSLPPRKITKAERRDEERRHKEEEE